MTRPLLRRAAILSTVLTVFAVLPLAMVNAQPTPKELLAQRTTLKGESATINALARLPLDSEILSQISADASDLRLYQGDQQLVHFVRRAPKSPAAIETRIEPAFGPQLDLRPIRDASGVPTASIEHYTVAVPPHDAESAQDVDWQLRFEVPSSRQDFASQLRLSWIDQTGSVPRLVHEGSLFRLRDGRERLAVDLPPVPRDRATPQWLLIELERQLNSNQSDHPLEPRFFFERFDIFEATKSAIAIPVELRIEEHPEHRSYHFELAAGLVPDALRIETSTGNFERVVRILGASLPGSTPRVLGAQSIRRLTTTTSTESPVIEVAISSANATIFELEITGGDAPALADLVVTALVSQPELIFEWPSGSEPIELYLGGGRVGAPNFDLWSRTARQLDAGRPSRINIDDEAEIRAQLDSGTLPLIRRGPIEPNGAFNTAPLLTFLQRPGAQVEAEQFQYQVPLNLGVDSSGLYRVKLGAAALAKLRDDLADLRFVDEKGQWPYVLTKTRERWTEALDIEPLHQARQSRYTLSFADALDPRDAPRALKPETLTLIVDAPFFDREYSIEAKDKQDKVVGSVRGRLTGTDAQSAFYSPNTTQTEATVALPIASAHHYDLIVENGDDAPLDIVAATLDGVTWEALLVAPPGSYRALLGEVEGTEISAPSYELARAAPVLHALRGTQVVPSRPQDNPDAKAASLWSTAFGQQALLWLAIAIAALGLGWVTLRSVS